MYNIYFYDISDYFKTISVAFLLVCLNRIFVSGFTYNGCTEKTIKPQKSTLLAFDEPLQTLLCVDIVVQIRNFVFLSVSSLGRFRPGNRPAQKRGLRTVLVVVEAAHRTVLLRRWPDFMPVVKSQRANPSEHFAPVQLLSLRPFLCTPHTRKHTHAPVTNAPVIASNRPKSFIFRAIDTLLVLLLSYLPYVSQRERFIFFFFFVEPWRIRPLRRLAGFECRRSAQRNENKR